MHIHHFYPRTNNIGDHFVQRGIERMVRELEPQATFELFDINSRGRAEVEYGLTKRAIERANAEANLIIVGGSNLYEGGYRWRWGVHLETGALSQLRVPLLLLGIGGGSGFESPLRTPSKPARKEIRLLNEHARLSGVRDVLTLEWLRALGVAKAELLGDPATFIFNQPPGDDNPGYILIALPPRRFWTSKRQFWKVRVRGRAMFRNLVSLTKDLLAKGEEVLAVCNDPADLPLAHSLFADVLPEVICPQTPEEYFELVSASRAVISGRLHTAVVAFSLGRPFILFDVDQRTHGFIETYQLQQWTLRSLGDGDNDLKKLTGRLLSRTSSQSWRGFIEQRDEMHARAMKLLANSLP